MRFVACLIFAFVCSGAFASDPGQPLDCSDWVFLEPGLSCRTVLDTCPSSPNRACNNDATRAADNTGAFLEAITFSNGGIQVIRYRDGVRSVVARLDNRPGAGATTDFAQLTPGYGEFGGFQPNSGRLYIGVDTSCTPLLSCSSTAFSHRLIVIEGFATSFDVLQTYTPQASLGFRVPSMPDGLAAADHFDTYYGNLTHPLDFTQAHPLACGYPAAAPQVGDYLTVADTVPTPAPGQGVYYVTSATYQGAGRYGRKTTAGHLTGRDPALLPACVP